MFAIIWCSLLSKNVKIKIYGTIILPVVLYVCESWSLILREETSLRVLETRVLRIVFGPNRDEVTGEWRKLHNEKLNDLYSSPDIIRVITSRRMGWDGHVTCMRQRVGYTRFWWRNLRERDLLGDLGLDGKIILGWIFRKWDVRVWTGSSWLMIGTAVGHL